MPRMRMKESDDYITLRAANPWTGAISPSVTPSLCTPHSPGTALEDAHVLLQEQRPVLHRTGEGDTGEWLTSQERWKVGSGMGVDVAAPHGQPAIPIGASKGLKDDEFVLRMPSAQEPQPFDHPGYSSEQIKACEQFNGQTRRARPSRHNQGVRVRSLGNSAQPLHPIIRRLDMQPTSSPRNPTEHHEAMASTHPAAVLEHLGTHGAVDRVHRKPVVGPPTLSELLPKVRLVHPELAAQARGQRSTLQADLRRCSLGCRMQESSGECLIREKVPMTSSRLFTGAQHSASVQSKSRAISVPEEICRVSMDLAIMVWAAVKHIPVPRIATLEALQAPDATPQQKMDAVRCLLSWTGQTIAIVTVLALLWQLSSALVRILGVVLWPLVVPFWILGWLVRAGGYP